MWRPRVIPCLLLRRRGLVKTVRFANPTYLGDPINIVRIFNDKEVDELVLLDITATVERSRPPFDLIEDIAGECFMPLAYGGGVRSLEEMRTLFQLGVEKIIVGSYAAENPAFIAEAAGRFGSQAVIVSIDVKRDWLRGVGVYAESGRRRIARDPVEYARSVEARGAGEVLLVSIDRDGTMQGYDLDLIRSVTEAVSIPVVACGGAGSVADLAAAVRIGGASAAGAGSLFVFHGPHRAVLINFPSPADLDRAFADSVANSVADDSTG